MKNSKLIFALIAIVLLSFGFTENEDQLINQITVSSISDTVRIGAQTWMAQNLNTDKFRNGDAIPYAKTNKEWQNADAKKQPAWCYFENDPANGAKYGKLYNWYAVNDPRGLAPEGWHIPSNWEWTKMTRLLGDKSIAGQKMKSRNDWEYGGTNESGFKALPGGSRSFNGPFSFKKTAEWWTSTGDEEGSSAFSVILDDKDHKLTHFGSSNKGGGMSVRCIKN